MNHHPPNNLYDSKTSGIAALMLTQLVIITILAILYGLGWHDQTGRESNEPSRTRGKEKK